MYDAVLQNEYEAAKRLLEQGANANTCNCVRSSPLHQASIHGLLQISQLLVSFGADVDAFDAYDQSPLYLAARNEHVDVVELLAFAGANVNSQLEAMQTTAAHLAAKNGDLATLTALVVFDADFGSVDAGAFDSLTAALYFRKFDVARLLLELNVCTTNANNWIQRDASVSDEAAQILLSNHDKKSVKTKVSYS